MHNIFKLIVTMVKPFYAVARGRTTGVFNTWADCRLQVDSFCKPIFKKFNTYDEAALFLESHGATILTTSKFNNNDIGSEYTGQTNSSNFSTSSSHKIVQTTKNTVKQSSYQNKQHFKNTDKKQTTETSNTQLENKQYGNHIFKEDNDGFVHVWTDGSCLGNGKKKATAGIGIYFGDNNSLNTALPVIGIATNNRGEIQAAIEAIRLAKLSGIQKLCLNTDSQFLIKSITEWMPNWIRRNWKTAQGAPVINRTDFEKLNELLADKKIRVKWVHVRAHIGILGNERADELAKEAASLQHIKFD